MVRDRVRLLHIVSAQTTQRQKKPTQQSKHVLLLMYVSQQLARVFGRFGSKHDALWVDNTPGTLHPLRINGFRPYFLAP